MGAALANTSTLSLSLPFPTLSLASSTPFPPISIDRNNSPETPQGKATAENEEGPSERKEKKGARRCKRGDARCGASSRERRGSFDGKRKQGANFDAALYFSPSFFPLFSVYPLFFLPLFERQEGVFLSLCSLQHSLVPSSESSNERESIARFGGVFDVLYFSSAGVGGGDDDGCCSFSPIRIVVTLVAEPLRAVGTFAFASHEQDDVVAFA